MTMEAWMILLGIVIQTCLALFAGYAMVIRSDISTKSLKVDVELMKRSMEKLSDVITRLAVTTERLDNFGERMNMQDRRLDDLSRGVGWKSQRATVDGDQAYERGS